MHATKYANTSNNNNCNCNPRQAKQIACVLWPPWLAVGGQASGTRWRQRRRQRQRRQQEIGSLIISEQNATGPQLQPRAVEAKVQVAVGS